MGEGEGRHPEVDQCPVKHPPAAGTKRDSLCAARRADAERIRNGVRAHDRFPGCDRRPDDGSEARPVPGAPTSTSTAAPSSAGLRAAAPSSADLRAAASPSYAVFARPRRQEHAAPTPLTKAPSASRPVEGQERSSRGSPPGSGQTGRGSVRLRGLRRPSRGIAKCAAPGAASGSRGDGARSFAGSVRPRGHPAAHVA
jgi:hypothetical protein